MDEKRAGAVRHSRTSHTSDYQRRTTLENIFDMKGAYVAHIPDTATQRIGNEVSADF